MGSLDIQTVVKNCHDDWAKQGPCFKTLVEEIQPCGDRELANIIAEDSDRLIDRNIVPTCGRYFPIFITKKARKRSMQVSMEAHAEGLVRLQGLDRKQADEIVAEEMERLRQAEIVKHGLKEYDTLLGGRREVIVSSPPRPRRGPNRAAFLGKSWTLSALVCLGSIGMFSAGSGWGVNNHIKNERLDVANQSMMQDSFYSAAQRDFTQLNIGGLTDKERVELVFLYARRVCGDKVPARKDVVDFFAED